MFHRLMEQMRGRQASRARLGGTQGRRRRAVETKSLPPMLLDSRLGEGSASLQEAFQAPQRALRATLEGKASPVEDAQEALSMALAGSSPSEVLSMLSERIASAVDAGSELEQQPLPSQRQQQPSASLSERFVGEQRTRSETTKLTRAVDALQSALASDSSSSAEIERCRQRVREQMQVLECVAGDDAEVLLALSEVRPLVE